MGAKRKYPCAMKNTTKGAPNERMREWRERRGWSAVQMGVALNCTAASVRQMEAGTMIPSRWVLVEGIRALTGVTGDDWGLKP